MRGGEGTGGEASGERRKEEERGEKERGGAASGGSSSTGWGRSYMKCVSIRKIPGNEGYYTIFLISLVTIML